MTKIRNSQPQIQRFEQKPNNLETNNEQKSYVRPVIITKGHNESLSETRALRDGIDYEVWVKYDLETNHKGKNGKGRGKGSKDKDDDDKKISLEAQLLAIIEEQQAEAAVQRKEIIKEEIKQEEIKRDQINTDEIKTDVRKSEIKTTDRKQTELNRDNLSEKINQDSLKKS